MSRYDTGRSSRRRYEDDRYGTARSSGRSRSSDKPRYVKEPRDMHRPGHPIRDQYNAPNNRSNSLGRRSGRYRDRDSWHGGDNRRYDDYPRGPPRSYSGDELDRYERDRDYRDYRDRDYRDQDRPRGGTLDRRSRPPRDWRDQSTDRDDSGDERRYNRGRYDDSGDERRRRDRPRSRTGNKYESDTDRRRPRKTDESSVMTDRSDIKPKRLQSKDSDSNGRESPDSWKESKSGKKSEISSSDVEKKDPPKKRKSSKERDNERNRNKTNEKISPAKIEPLKAPETKAAPLKAPPKQPEPKIEVIRRPEPKRPEPKKEEPKKVEVPKDIPLANITSTARADTKPPPLRREQSRDSSRETPRGPPGDVRYPPDKRDDPRGGYTSGRDDPRGGYTSGRDDPRAGYASGRDEPRGYATSPRDDPRGGYTSGRDDPRGGYTSGRDDRYDRDYRDYRRDVEHDNDRFKEENFHRQQYQKENAGFRDDAPYGYSYEEGYPPREYGRNDYSWGAGSERPIVRKHRKYHGPAKYPTGLVGCCGVLAVLFCVCLIALGIVACIFYNGLLGIGPFAAAAACALLAGFGFWTVRSRGGKTLMLVKFVFIIATLALLTVTVVFCVLSGLYIGDYGYRDAWRRPEVSYISVACLFILIPALIAGMTMTAISCQHTCCAGETGGISAIF